MTTSILTSTDPSTLLNTVLVDLVQIYDVGEPVTTGIQVTRELTPVGEPVPACVQTTFLNNSVESRTDSTYSIKVSIDTPMRTGQAVKALVCIMEPDLAGKTFLLDKVTGSLIRKGVAALSEFVNQQGKESVA